VRYWIASNSFRVLATMSFLLVACAICWAGEKAHREAGAHEHGNGRANIAVEGNKLLFELEMPAADVVGFEHDASTAAQKTAVADAKKLLGQPTAIIALPAAANCRVRKSSSEFEKHGGEHAEFHAAYELECGNIAALATMEFKHFKAFPRAKKLDVVVIGSRAQKSFDVTPEQPTILFKGLF